MKVAGHNAIIVGGASGMALATAEMFVEKGGKVAIVDLAKSDGAAVAHILDGHITPLGWSGDSRHAKRLSVNSVP